MKQEKTERKSVFWLVIFRLIAMTSLLISALIIQFAASSFPAVTPYYALIFGVYALSLVYLAFYYGSRHYTIQAYIQLFFDILIITAFVYISGGVTSATYALYIFAIIGAGLVVGRRAAFLFAALSAISFGLLVDGLYFGLIPYFRPEHAFDFSFGNLLFTLVTAWTSFFVIAVLMNSLAGELRKTRAALRLTEKELIIRERLAEAGRFSAGLAHEIRNPLAAISGAVQVLRDGLAPGDANRELMDIVVKESRRVSQAIDQFLDFASAGRETFTDADLAGLMDETVKILRAGGELNGKIAVGGNYAASGVRYFGSANQFKQVFWNLARNAVKAMPEGGTFTIDFERRKKDVVLRFADTGRGMTAEERARIFEPFYSGFGNGRGLGLATVRRIVDDYDGRIDVASEPGRGTDIVVTLPVVRPTG